MQDAQTITKTAAHTAIASLLALGLVAATGNASAADAKDKCYGVAKAGQNDCGGKYSTHACAGQSKIDKDPNSFKLVAAGTCEKMGGSLKSAGEMAAMKK